VPVTPIEVVDTAIKIGLGGLITLLGSIAVVRLNHSNEERKERSRRFFDAIEEASTEIEETTHIALRYWALVIEWVRNQRLGMDLVESRRDELERSKKDLFDSFKKMSISEAKLMLFQCKAAASLAREYGEFLKHMRRHYYDGHKGLTEEQMNEVRQQLLAKREALFEELSEAYKRGS
jgi:hypothetical protein